MGTFRASCMEAQSPDGRISFKPRLSDSKLASSPTQLKPVRMTADSQNRESCGVVCVKMCDE